MDKTKKNCILIIDDEPMVIQALSNILMPEFTVFAAKDGQDAVKKAEKLLPDIILLDIVMPGLDGYDVLSVIKTADKTREIPVIIITDLDDIDAEEKGLALGAADYIAKPFRPAIVRLRVRNQMRLIERLRQQMLMTKNTLNAMEKILNSIDAAIYVTVPETGELLFVNKYMKTGFGLEGDKYIGDFCYKVFRNGVDAKCDFCPCYQLENNPDATIIWDEVIPEVGIHVRHSDSLINWHDGSKVHLQHAVDITELVEAKETAQAASQVKSDFLATLSHEMQTPLNAIADMTLIGKKTDDDEQKVHAFNEIGDATVHLLSLVNDVLDMAKIESENTEIFPIE